MRESQKNIKSRGAEGTVRGGAGADEGRRGRRECELTPPDQDAPTFRGQMKFGIRVGVNVLHLKKRAPGTLGLGRFLRTRFEFWASDFDPIGFSDVNLPNRNSRPMRKNQVYFACRNSGKRRDRRLLLWSGAAKRRAGCAALRGGTKRPSQG